jgi:hypothetical protein
MPFAMACKGGGPGTLKSRRDLLTNGLVSLCRREFGANVCVNAIAVGDDERRQPGPDPVF